MKVVLFVDNFMSHSRRSGSVNLKYEMDDTIAKRHQSQANIMHEHEISGSIATIKIEE